MFQLQSLSIAKRLWIMVGCALAGTLVVVGVGLFSERTLVLQEKEAAVRQTVEVAHGVVAHMHALVVKGDLSEADGKRMALETLKSLRYSGTDYFWVNDMQLKMLMHAVKPEMDGTDLRQYKDPNGYPLFVQIVDTVKSKGAGLVYYQWPKPGSDHPVQKISYVKGFEPWGWVVGSGVYVDMVDAAMAGRAVEAALGALVVVGVLLVTSYFVARSLLQQLGGEPAYAAGIMRRMAGGDLSTLVSVDAGSSAGSLLHELQATQVGFSRIVARVRQGSEMVATTSAEIAQGNNDLSVRTEQQANALQHTTAAMQDLQLMVESNTENARMGNELAQVASAEVVKGGAVVGRAVETMKNINDSSRKISDIIGVIDGIAFQTNILALNAAVEAARAGEQGRGFAVVASEVRSLAGRSAEAAKEIKTLITDSVERVEQGTTQVNEAGNTMSQVASSIKRVTDIMAEIAHASTEQAGSVHGLRESMTQIDHATQQNAALVEEMAAAAMGLQSQSNELLNSVAIIHVGQSDRLLT